MIHVFPVAQFMHDDIIPHRCRTQHQQAVEIQVALTGAASPASFLQADGDPAVGYAQQARKVPHLFRQFLHSLPGQRFDFFLGKVGDCLAAHKHGQVFFDPCRVFSQAFTYFFLRHAPGRTHFQGILACHTDGQGFPVTADNGDLKPSFHILLSRRWPDPARYNIILEEITDRTIL